MQGTCDLELLEGVKTKTYLDGLLISTIRGVPPSSLVPVAAGKEADIAVEIVDFRNAVVSQGRRTVRVLPRAVAAVLIYHKDPLKLWVPPPRRSVLDACLKSQS